ncbi:MULTISPECIES: hypothetical protein [unclassified Streptomyces]|uniref:hypothetical protein n=1 Tax=unclassified Streptomyces TaxID=2593676 RepID=UPI002E2CAA9D|nr:hypothetical protein [Streptomyces sp. NBC_01429]
MQSKNRRRGRTALLIATAAVLGLVAGTATGYAIQADRAPTPLPALGQPGLAHPAKPLPAGKAAKALGAARDSQVRVEGDLRKLLISAPPGSRAGFADWDNDGWLSPSAYAAYFGVGEPTFDWLVASDVRRIAARSWERGEGEGNVVLMQFRPGMTDLGAAAWVESTTYFNQEEAGYAGDPVKGSVTGRYFTYEAGDDSEFEAPYPYQAVGAARRGDVVAIVNLFDAEPIPKKDIATLIERQLERL